MRLSLLPLIIKQATRNRVRSLLTISGIAIAMFLFTSIQAMQTGVNEATTASADDTKLVVYRKDRFCPATSQLPQDYQSRIERIAGVTSALPIKVVVTNCGTSLDVVTFRGVPKESFLEDREGKIEVLSGSTQEWMSRSDATLVGETLAKRRGLQVGKHSMPQASGRTSPGLSVRKNFRTAIQPSLHWTSSSSPGATNSAS